MKGLSKTDWLDIVKSMLSIGNMHATNIGRPIQSLLALDLNLLKVLNALWHCRRLTEAGQMIGLSQPAMSHALRRLRTAFSDELFVRGVGGLVPTPRCQALAPLAAEALAALERAILPPQPFMPAASRRHFRIGMNDYVSATLLPRLLAVLTPQAPQVTLEVIHLSRGRNQGAPVLPALLEEGRIELAVGQIGEVPGRCQRETLRADPHVCVLAASHPALRRPFDLDAYLGLRHVKISSFPERRGWIDELLESLRVRRQIAVVVPHFLAALNLVAETELAVTLPLGAVQPFQRAFGLAVCPPPFAARPHQLEMCWLQVRGADAGLAWLRGVITEAAGGAAVAGVAAC